MQSFKQFLNESTTFDIEKFKKDCSFVLSMLKPGQFLYRGGPEFNKDFTIAKWHSRSTPLNTQPVAHDIFNEYSEKRWNFPMRNWMFCTGNEDDAEVYAINGTYVMAIFPIGEFEWLCNTEERFSDLTVALNSKIYELIKERNVSNSDKEARQVAAVDAANKITKEFDLCNWHFNTDLNYCIRSKNEIMFKCNKYYAFNIYGDTFKMLRDNNEI